MSENNVMKNSENDVRLKGIIVHKFVTPKIAIVTINTGNATPVPNYPKILFFGDLREKVEKEFEVRDHVTITGNLQSSKPKENVKNQNMQSIFGESICATQSAIEDAFGVEGSPARREFLNTFKVAGEVMSISYSSPNLVHITIKTLKNNRPSFVRFDHYVKQPEDILTVIKPRDFVYGVGCVQTNRRENSRGETVYYENYVLSDIAKA